MSLHAIEEGLSGWGLHRLDNEFVRAYDPAAQAVIAAFSTPPTVARAALINSFIIALKVGGIWSKLDCLYVFAAANSQAALINWKTPGTFDATLVNSPSFVADRGFTGNSTNYISTSLNPSTAGGSYTQNNAHISVRNRTAGTGGARTSLGVIDGGLNAAQIRRNSDTGTSFCINATATDPAVVADQIAWFVANRASSGTLNRYRNAVSLGDASRASSGVPNATFTFLARAGINEFSDIQVSSGSIGGALSSTEISAFYAAELAYMQAVGAA